MCKLSLLLSFLLTACGGTAIKEDRFGVNRDPNPDVSGFTEVETTTLITTPYRRAWTLNEIYADTTDLPGVVGSFTFTSADAVELMINFEEVQVTEPTAAGGADPTYILIRADGSRTFVAREEPFTVGAGEAITLRVSMPNIAKAHSIDVVFGVNTRPL